jgi:hypothetical protein
LRKVDETIKNYSKVVMELTIIYDHWQNLEPEECTAEEFGKMVRGCEHVLWAQNVEFVKSMQEALQEADLEREAVLINQVIQESVESAERAKGALRENILETQREFLADTEVKLDQTAKAALGTLAEEASSEIVQKELDAMSSAITAKGRKMIARASSFLSSITEVKEEFKDVEITKDTSTEELNTILERYPTTPDVKG